MKDVLDMWKTLGGLLASLGAGIGVLSVFVYCWSNGAFYPSGLSLTDSFFFLFVGCAFGFAYLLWLLPAFLLCWFVLSSVRDRPRWPSSCAEKIRHWAVSSLLIAVCLALFLVYTTVFVLDAVVGAEGLRAATCFIAPIFAGFALAVAFDPGPRSPRMTGAQERRFRFALTGVGLLAPLVMAATVVSQIPQGVLRHIGIYRDRVDLSLSGENYDRVRVAAQAVGVPVLGCEGQAQKDRLVTQARLLWHGLGDRSLVQFMPRTVKGRKVPAPFVVELKADGVQVVTSGDEAWKMPACVVYTHEVSFENNVATTESSEARSLDAFVDRRLNNPKYWSYRQSIVVVGRADDGEMAQGGKSNLALSQRRASFLATMAKARADTVPAFMCRVPIKVSSSGIGSRERRSQCEGLSRTGLIDCREPDRRADVQVVYDVPEVLVDPGAGDGG